jgi:type VI secretion system secreted protein VgrG
MPSALSQSGRPLTIDTPLGSDALVVARLEADEGLSQLFHYRLQLLAPHRPDGVPAHELLGQPVVIHLNGSAKRIFHGIVQKVVELEQHFDRDFLHFEAEVVPTLWLWTQRVRSRIFQRQTVPDILRAVLSELRPNVHFQNLLANYPVRDYVVQYRESDFDFISRLMEEEGISYYFRHEAFFEEDDAGKKGPIHYRHVLVLVDRVAMFPSLPESANLRYDDAPETPATAPRIHAWKTNQQVRREVFTLRDQHFGLAANESRKSLRTLQAGKTVGDSVQVGTQTRPLKVKPLKAESESLEWYEHNTGFARRFEGDKVSTIFEEQRRQAQLFQESETAGAIWVEGRTSYVHLVPGFKFNVSNLRAKDGTYLLSRVVQTVAQTGFRSGEAGQLLHECSFTSLPEVLPVRPPRKTAKPRIEGTQTAVVTGMGDKGIDVDAFGRVRVQFYWDRADRYNENSSCWVRVSQLWAGNRWGAFFWPRPGMEVIVSFEDGDPDRPLITGCVYNAANMPPAHLPDGADTAGIKSCSVGSANGPNTGLFFHDTPGREHVFQHSPWDDARINRGTSYRSSVGPDIEFIGGSLIPTGSGGGGGLADLAAALGDTYLKPGLKSIPSGMDALSALLNSLVPKKADYTAGGNSLSVTLAGTKHTHSLFTRKADYSISDDVEAMGRALGYEVHPAITFIARALTGFSPLPQAASLSLFSNVLKQDYWGVSYTLERKGKEVKHVGGPLIQTEKGKDKKGVAKKANPQYEAIWVAGVWTSLGLIGALVTAADVLVVFMNRKYAELDVEIKAITGDDDQAKKDKTAKTKSQDYYNLFLQMMVLATQIVLPLAHKVLYTLETSYAELVAVRKKYKELTDELESLATLIQTFDLPALVERQAELDLIKGKIKTATNVALASMMDIKKSLTEVVDSELDGYVQKDYSAGLSVSGPNVDVVALQALDTSKIPPEPKADTGAINLVALGEKKASGDPSRQGRIQMKADGLIGMRVRDAHMGLDGAADAKKAQAYITVGKDDEIKLLKSTGDGLRLGPLTITMSDAAIELKAGSATTGFSSLKIEAGGITLSSAAASQPAATLKLTAAEITSKLGVSEVKQSLDGLVTKVGENEEKLTTRTKSLILLNKKTQIQLQDQMSSLEQTLQSQTKKLEETIVKIG